MKSKDSLMKNTLLLSMGTFLTKGLSFIMVPFFSKWLSTAEYGSFDLMATYVTLLLPLIGLASNEAVFRFSMEAESKQEKSKYISNSLIIFSINSCLLLCVMIVAKLVFDWEMAFCFFVLAIGEIFNLHLRGFLRAIKHLDIYSFVSAVITVFIAVFTTILIKVFGLGLEGMLLGYGFGYISGNIIIVCITKYWTYVSFRYISFSVMKGLVSYSYALIPNSLAWWFINVSDRTIINLILGAASNGIYAIAYKIPNILSAVFSVFSVSWQQSATEVLNDKKRDIYYNSVYNKMIVILLGLCCGVLSLNSWLFNYIFDERYYSGYVYAPILIAGTVFATLSQFYGSLQISFKQPKENGISTVIGAVSNLIIHLALVYFIGLYAAAISTVLSQIVVCWIRHIRLKKLVVLRVSSSTIAMYIVYLYFTVAAYFISNNLFNILNVLLATAVVMVVVRDFLVKIVKKMKKVIAE